MLPPASRRRFAAAPDERRPHLTEPDMHSAESTKMGTFARRRTLVYGALLVLLLGTSGASFTCADAELVRLDPGTGDRAEAVEVGDPTMIGHLAVGDGEVWLERCGPIRVGIEDREVVRSEDDGRPCGPIAYSSGSVWRLSGRELVKLDPVTGEAHTRLPGRVLLDLVVEGMDLAAGPQGVFVANPGDCSVSRFEPADLKLTRRVRMPAACRGFWVRAMSLAAGSGGVWVSDGYSRTLYRLDPRHLAVSRRLRLRDRPRDVAIGRDAVWVATDRGRLVAVNPLTAAVIRSIDLENSLSHVATGAGATWVTSYDGDAVFRVDSGDLQVNKLELHQPAGIAVSGRQVWVSAVDECC
jgi:streptogramin lyase